MRRSIGVAGEHAHQLRAERAERRNATRASPRAGRRRSARRRGAAPRSDRRSPRPARTRRRRRARRGRARLRPRRRLSTSIATPYPATRPASTAPKVSAVMLRPVMITTVAPAAGAMRRVSSAATPTAPEPSAINPVLVREEPHCGRDVGLRHGHDVCDRAADEIEGDGSGLEVSRETVGEGRPGRDGDRVTGVERGAQRGRLRGLDPDDARTLTGARSGEADPRREATASDGCDDGGEAGHLLEQPRRRSFPDPRSRRDRCTATRTPRRRRRARGRGPRLRRSSCRDARAPTANRSIAASFAARRVLGGDHGRRRSEPIGRERDAEAVIARRRRDDRRAPVAGERGRHRNEGAAHLERTGRLKGLQLQPYVVDRGPEPRPPA